MPCPRCQHKNPAGQKFCGECGTPLAGALQGGPPGASYADLQRTLSESLDQQTATSDILRVISSSPSDVQPVFDAVAGNALRLCVGDFSNVVRYDGEFLRLAAYAHVSIEGVEAMKQL